jgi:hypothetical protein
MSGKKASGIIHKCYLKKCKRNFCDEKTGHYKMQLTKTNRK